MRKKKTKLEETSQNIGRLICEINDLARNIRNRQRAYNKKMWKLYTMVGSLLEEKELELKDPEDEEVRECLSLAETLRAKLQNHFKKWFSIQPILCSFLSRGFFLKKIKYLLKKLFNHTKSKELENDYNIPLLQYGLLSTFLHHLYSE